MSWNKDKNNIKNKIVLLNNLRNILIKNVIVLNVTKYVILMAL
jgi:hypothetical protein